MSLWQLSWNYNYNGQRYNKAREEKRFTICHFYNIIKNTQAKLQIRLVEVSRAASIYRYSMEVDSLEDIESWDILHKSHCIKYRPTAIYAGHVVAILPRVFSKREKVSLSKDIPGR